MNKKYESPKLDYIIAHSESIMEGIFDVFTVSGGIMGGDNDVDMGENDQP